MIRRVEVRGEEVVDPARGLIRCQHWKAAIVGAGPGREDAPFGDGDWCVWAINEIWQPRFDRHFELHPMDVQSPRDLAFLAQCQAPTYVLEPTPLVPNGVVFPLERLRAAGFREYFACTFAFQVALAVLDGFKAIGLWGVGLYDGTARERTAERACVEYWLGVAEGRGIRVVADSGLARAPYLYGYDYHQEKRLVESEIARLGALMRQEADRRSTR